jgi:hypothetical protein
MKFDWKTTDFVAQRRSPSIPAKKANRKREERALDQGAASNLQSAYGYGLPRTLLVVYKKCSCQLKHYVFFWLCINTSTNQWRHKKFLLY